MTGKFALRTAAVVVLTFSTSFTVIDSFSATNGLATTNSSASMNSSASINSSAVPIGERIQQLDDRLSEISLQIRIANGNKEREKVAELRDEREQVQEVLRELRHLHREEKAAAEKLANREATERVWVTYPPEKQLCAAIEYHRLDLVEKVVEGGQIDLNKTNDYCFFPLADAAARGQMDIVEYLLQKKSPLAMRAVQSQRLASAIDAAAISKHARTEVLELLKKNGGTLNDSQEDSEPGSVAEDGGEAVKKMLDKKYRATAGSTLFRALEDGHIDNIRWLLKEGANPNESVLDRTALMVAVDSNDQEKVSLLIQAGADVNLRGPNQSSVLAHAEKRREQVNGRKKAEMDEIVRYLKSLGATKPGIEF